ncbi:nucleoside hydrolase [Providencia huaxiensis]|uniref:Nucleoside hydrolase n=1 Tax=Providencia huaxiensis TaxID=2027290 RepID=A0ABU2IZE5_9GAMM|nr:MULTISPECIES: nucleoside hydrolase [Providencia]MBZ3681405.1 nucleoside hydrolase [Providencia rettgeri]AXH61816.1 nucleoside hydrolase [Providencia huaxiensis]MBN6363612.1 nucleoside hydrolase [Providencia huaxiensis]MCD2528060.1 nucleoside hydrolase [Providencia huaxiensis]MCG9537428.1 nucleoside hydrolase [Providencia huaxiensis]
MHKIIIDCDPGVDDAVAIFLALASPEIELIGITTVAGNVELEKVHSNARQLLALANRQDIPLAKGCERPLMSKSGSKTHVHGTDGLAGVLLPASDYQNYSGHAVDFIIDTVMSNPGEITLCTMASLTNIAVAIIKEPKLVDNVKDIVVMGGAAFTQGNITPAAEFNFYVDPHAAHIVFDSARHITMLGLDVTSKADIRAGLCSPLEKGGLIAQTVAEMCRRYAEFDPFLHDPCVIAYLIKPEIFSGVDGSITIEYESNKLFGHSFAYTSTTINHDPKAKYNEAKCKIITDVDTSKLISLITERIITL